MARPQASAILAQLAGAPSFADRITALQAIKNDIVGHVQRKEWWVKAGALEPIVATLSYSQSSARPNGKDLGFHPAVRPLPEEDAVRLQALQLVASFANGSCPTAFRIRIRYLT